MFAIVFIYHSSVVDDDFNTASISITFNSMVQSICATIATNSDSLIEDPEMFNVMIVVTDPALSSETGALVTIGDSNSTLVLVEFVEVFYQGLEGDTLSVCVSFLSSNVSDVIRTVVLQISTEAGTAQGINIHT